MKFSLIICFGFIFNFARTQPQLFNYLNTDQPVNGYDSFDKVLLDGENSRFEQISNENSLSKSLMDQANSIIQNKRRHSQYSEMDKNRILSDQVNKLLEQKNRKYSHISQLTTPQRQSNDHINSYQRPLPTFGEDNTKFSERNKISGTLSNFQIIKSYKTFTRNSTGESLNILEGLGLENENLKIRFGEIVLTAKEWKKLLKFGIEMLGACGVNLENCVINESPEEQFPVNEESNSKELSDSEAAEKLNSILRSSDLGIIRNN